MRNRPEGDSVGEITERCGIAVARNDFSLTSPPGDVTGPVDMSSDRMRSEGLTS
jgi:hypothetical protein